MLNAVQEYLLEEILKEYFDNICSLELEDGQTSLSDEFDALNALSIINDYCDYNYSLKENAVKYFQECKILEDIDYFAKLMMNPCPQNSINDNPKGILNLVGFNKNFPDISNEDVTKEDIINFIRKTVEIKIKELKITQLNFCKSLQAALDNCNQYKIEYLFKVSEKYKLYLSDSIRLALHDNFQSGKFNNNPIIGQFTGLLNLEKSKQIEYVPSID